MLPFLLKRKENEKKAVGANLCVIEKSFPERENTLNVS